MLLPMMEDRKVLHVILFAILVSHVSGSDNTDSNQTSAEFQTSIPLGVFRNMSFFSHLKDPKKVVELFFTQTRRKIQGGYGLENITGNINMTWIESISAGGVERSSLGSKMDFAGCSPYDTCVTLPNNKPDVMIYPSCVLIKQCGGCCGHPSLVCKPTETQNKLVEVLKYVYDGSGMFPIENIDYISIEEHVACDCMCKVQASDCNPKLHDYDPFECGCVCKNQHLSSSCPQNKRWNHNLCGCQCSSILNCGVGYRYNMNTCRCEEDVLRSGNLPVESSLSNASSNPAPVSTPPPCSHLSCAKRYKPTLTSGGKCTCIFDRSA